jgi:superfamily I DNA/RNA helicase
MIDGKKETSELDLHTLRKIVQDLSIDGDWLIMAPTNRSVNHISEIFQKYEISHFRKNEPITLKNEKKVSRNIRVQTIHTSKGAEAENVAIVLMTRGDGYMYYKNGIHSDRLAYVAESRHRNRLYRIGLKSIAVSLETAIDDTKKV